MDLLIVGLPPKVPEAGNRILREPGMSGEPEASNKRRPDRCWLVSIETFIQLLRSQQLLDRGVRCGTTGNGKVQTYLKGPHHGKIWQQVSASRYSSLEHREKVQPFRSLVKEKARLLLQRTIGQGQFRSRDSGMIKWVRTSVLGPEQGNKLLDWQGWATKLLAWSFLNLA